MRRKIFGFHSRHAFASEVFLYITALLIFALVIFFGYHSITTFIDKGERVSFITFKTTLERSVQDVARNYGGVVVFDAHNPLSIPAPYKSVCFVDVDIKPPTDCSALLGPIICDAWQTSFTAGGLITADSNVFMVPVGIIPIKVSHIKVDSNGNHAEDASDAAYLCADISSHRLDIRLEGKGDHALVSLS